MRKTIFHRTLVAAFITLILVPIAHAAFFSQKEGKTFETRGAAYIYFNGTFTTGIEQKNIPIPSYIDVTRDPRWSGLSQDAESGWTKCRVPLKRQNLTDRELVFECKPLTYF
jgi:hypothetical protein